MHIERFSDKNKTTFTRDSLSQILMFNEFPKELVRGMKEWELFSGQWLCSVSKNASAFHYAF